MEPHNAPESIQVLDIDCTGAEKITHQHKDLSGSTAIITMRYRLNGVIRWSGIKYDESKHRGKL